MKRLYAIAKKEVKQLSRDVRMLFVLFFFPVFLLGVFGYAVNFDVKHIKLAVHDKEKSDVTREFIRSLSGSEYFDVVLYIENESNVKQVLDDKEAQCVVVFPEDFSKKIYYGKESAQVQFLIDGVDGNTATIIKGYVEAATNSFNISYQSDMFERYGMNMPLPVDLHSRFWYNPDLESTQYFIPGLIALILVITAVVSVALTLVREKERGTIEQINVSSIKTIELLVGKSLPYVVLALINAAFILTCGYILFDMVVKGSYLLLFGSTLLFLVAATSIGIFISTVSDSQQVAFTLATFSSMLPAVVLSGFIFPIESMPEAVQVITNLTPAKFYIITLRAIVLRGVGLEAFWQHWVYMAVFAIVPLLLASVVRKKKLAKS